MNKEKKLKYIFCKVKFLKDFDIIKKNSIHFIDFTLANILYDEEFIKFIQFIEFDKNFNFISKTKSRSIKVKSFDVKVLK